MLCIGEGRWQRGGPGETIDEADVAALRRSWRRAGGTRQGPMRALHRFNPGARRPTSRRCCGAAFAPEAAAGTLARGRPRARHRLRRRAFSANRSPALGAAVTGVDPAANNVADRARHMRRPAASPSITRDVAAHDLRSRRRDVRRRARRWRSSSTCATGAAFCARRRRSCGRAASSSRRRSTARSRATRSASSARNTCSAGCRAGRTIGSSS